MQKFIWVPFLVFFSFIKAYSQIIDGVAAVISNEIITLSELERICLPFIENDPSIGKDGERIKELKRMVLNQLIDNKLIEKEIKRLGIEVSATELERALSKVEMENSLTREKLIQV